MVVSVAPGPCQVVLSGRLDTHGVPEARTALHAAIDTGSGDVNVDVSGVEVLDATGLGVLVGAHRRAARLGRRLVLHDASPRLLRILGITGLHRVLTVEPVTGQ